MIAPPRPHSREELEALIKEARARQLRRRLLGAGGVAIAAAAGLAVYAFLIGGTNRTATAGGGRSRAAACGIAGGWSMSLSPDWPEPTGQHTAPVVLKRLGSAPCVLTGYPKVVLLDAQRKPLGFRYSHRGDEVVAARPPSLVKVAGDGSAFFLLNKYRCDIHYQGIARWLRVALPDVRGRLTVRLPRYPILDYCPADPPSRTIAVSPLVPELTRAAATLP